MKMICWQHWHLLFVHWKCIYIHFWEPSSLGWTSVFLLFVPSLRLIYFGLGIITIFDLVIHICIFIIHAEYFWENSLKEKFYPLILKFVCITFSLLTEPQTMLQLKIVMTETFFIVKFLLSLCIPFIHCSFLCQVSIDLIYFSSFFGVLASSLVNFLILFLTFE